LPVWSFAHHVVDRAQEEVVIGHLDQLGIPDSSQCSLAETLSQFGILAGSNLAEAELLEAD
jgi:hypothetical protein